MSSLEEFSIEPLHLIGGWKKKEKPIIRRLRDEHGTLSVSLPKKECKNYGYKSGQYVLLRFVKKLVLERKGSILNLMNWELRRIPYVVMVPIEKKNGESFDQANDSSSNR